MSQVTENTSSPLAETGNWLWTPVTSHREKRAQTEVGAGAWGPPVLSLSCHRVSQRTALGLSPRRASDALRPESARVGRLAGPRIRSQVPGEESAESPPARGSRAARVECGAPRLPPRRDARRARRPGKGHRIPGVGFTSAVPRALRPALADVRHPAWVPLGDCQDPGLSAASPGAVGTRGRLARPSGSHGSGGPR